MTEEDWRARLDRRLTSVETQLASVKLRDAVAEVHQLNVETRLKNIEGTMTWVVRLLIGAILLALVGFIVGGGIAP